MAFRNPLQSIPASGIIGLIQGSQLAADSIDGKTITGAVFRTAATGKRLTIDSAAQSQILAYGNEPGEISPAIFDMSEVGANAVTRIRGADLGYGTAQLVFTSGTGVAFDAFPGNRVDLFAYEGQIGPFRWYNGLARYGAWLEFDTEARFSSPIKAPNIGTQAGSTVVTLNSLGNAAIPYPKAYASSPTVVASNGDYLNGPTETFSMFGPPLLDHFNIHGTTPNVSRRINWIAVGTLA